MPRCTWLEAVLRARLTRSTGMMMVMGPTIVIPLALIPRIELVAVCPLGVVTVLALAIIRYLYWKGY